MKPVLVDNLQSGDWVVFLRMLDEDHDDFSGPTERGWVSSRTAGIPFQVISVDLPFILCRPASSPQTLSIIDTRVEYVEEPDQSYVAGWVFHYKDEWERARVDAGQKESIRGVCPQCGNPFNKRNGKWICCKCRGVLLPTSNKSTLS